MTVRRSNFDRSGKHLALAVDDSRDVLDAVKATLERGLPIVVETATSGEEALRLLSQRDYDLILCDYHMPGMTGIDLLRGVRAASPTTLRVMMTTDTDFELAVKAVNDGAILAFLPKPIDAKTLIEKAGRALDERHHAMVKEQALERQGDVARREASAGRDVARPYTGSLGDSTRPR